MKRVKLVLMCEAEQQELRQAFKHIETFEEQLKLRLNQTLLLLDELKNAHPWRDPVKMIEYLDLLKKLKALKIQDGTILLEDQEVKTLIEVIQGAFSSGGIQPKTNYVLGYLAEIYTSLVNAEEITA